jgi:hypothetical protein
MLGQDLGVGVRFGIGVGILVNAVETVLGIAVSVVAFSTGLQPIKEQTTNAKTRYFIIILKKNRKIYIYYVSRRRNELNYTFGVFDTTRGQRVCPRRSGRGIREGDGLWSWDLLIIPTRLISERKRKDTKPMVI